jgi:hypothetical protein
MTGATAPTPAYGDLQLGLTIAGPLRIPWLVRNGPMMQFGYQHGIGQSASTRWGLVPTEAERAGDFSMSASAIRDPLTGEPFPGGVIPVDRISPQARALLGLYPHPNEEGLDGANYQRATVTHTTSDSLQIGLNKSWRGRPSMSSNIAWQRSDRESTDLLGFTDRIRQSSLNLNLSGSWLVSSLASLRARYQYSRTSSGTTPHFAGRIDVSGDAGIVGNSDDPADWGPPNLVFPDLARLSVATGQRTVSQMHAIGGEVLLRRGSHNVTVGGDLRWNLVTVRGQPDPRGTLTFTGAMTGSALADFLLGLPATSALALGTDTTRLRNIAPDAYVNDDWRVTPTMTINAGVRWEYDAPFTESSGRLANLEVGPRFSSVQPVLAANPVGLLTGARYPSSLIRPDKGGVEPRLGVSWRPALSSTLVLKAAYGLYRNLGGYESLALLLSQQPPFARTFNIASTPQAPLSLADAFPLQVPTEVANTYAVDPDFRAAYAHNWQVSIQRDLPASLTFIAAYLGEKGSHLPQAILPNTEPPGSTVPSSGPAGFVYLTSNGRSSRHAAQLTLRRRLYSGFTATVQYTLAKATDDAATFSNRSLGASALSIAQDWRNPEGERGPSSFDQRHKVDVQFQYTTGVGLTGGTLVDGFWGSLWKDWTVATQFIAGSGLPSTPVAFLTVEGTGVVGIRPSLTGLPTGAVGPDSYANPAAYSLPAPGMWGTADRNSLRGAAEMSMDLSLSRVFRLGSRLNLEWRADATNVLNLLTYSTLDAVFGSPRFGRPTAANPMRTLRMSMRLRF